MDESPVRLACLERGVKLTIGLPVLDWKGQVTGFDVSAGAGGGPTRRVRLQALSKLLADGPVDGLSMHSSRSTGLDGLREIGGTAEEGGIPFEDYLHDQPLEWITYYGRNRPGRLRYAVLRRREIDGRIEAVDEEFSRCLRWEPTDHLRRLELDHKDVEQIEISEGEAFQAVFHLLLKKLPFVTNTWPWERPDPGPDAT